MYVDIVIFSSLQKEFLFRNYRVAFIFSFYRAARNDWNTVARRASTEKERPVWNCWLTRRGEMPSPLLKKIAGLKGSIPNLSFLVRRRILLLHLEWLRFIFSIYLGTRVSNKVPNSSTTAKSIKVQRRNKKRKQEDILANLCKRIDNQTWHYHKRSFVPN